MDQNLLLNQISDNVFTRQDLLLAVQTLDKSFKKTQFRYLLGKLQKSKVVERVGHNLYRKGEKGERKYEYSNLHSDESKKVIKSMTDNFPLLDFRVWELSWLNEFFNHQIGRNVVFLEVENEGCEYAYSELSDDFHGRILFKPTLDELLRYGIDNEIIIDRLITESPKGKSERYNVPLEKIVVDLFANKILQGILPKADYPMAIKDIFSKYMIDQVRLFRYAKRRNKGKGLYDFLTEKTDIEVLVEI